MKDLLPEYAAGSLPEPQRRQVDCHLAGCADCRAELATWLVVAEAAGQVPDPAGPPRRLTAPAAPAMIRVVLSRSSVAAPVGAATPARRPRLRPALVAAEARLVRPAVLVGSALLMALGVVLAAAQPVPGAWSAEIFTVIIPIVAAAGIAGVCAPGRDPLLEVTAATPTSPRLLLLIRVSLVFGYDLVLALTASVGMTAFGDQPTGLNALIMAWLGPMALLCALSLVLAVWLGQDLAVGAALGVWALSVLVDSGQVDPGWLTAVVDAVWSTNPFGAVASVLLVVVAVVISGHGEPVRRARATHLT